MNKANFIEVVNTKLPDGSNIPSSDHRLTMHTEPNSVEGIVYNDEVNDTNIIQGYTVSNSNFDYSIKLHKVGARVFITGDFEAKTSVPAASEIFSISEDDYKSNEFKQYTGSAREITGFDFISVYISDSSLKTHTSILVGERYFFTIDFKSFN